MSFFNSSSATSLEQLKAAESLQDIAGILGYSAKGLSYILYRQAREAKYTEFKIRKRGGGERTIHSPEPRLKRLQESLAKVLAQADHETQIAPPGRVLSHGFRKDFSIVTNAQVHVGKRHVLNVDISDFFPSFNFGRVRGFLINSKDYRLSPLVATIIAQIACHNNSLPQGSPSSPVITNIVGRILDVQMVRLAKHYGCQYSRYADDITFSTNELQFPPSLAFRKGRNQWVAGKDLLSAIDRAGFSLNESKTRLSSRIGRQTVTGLTVNTRVNVSAIYYRYARAMAHQLFSTGSYTNPLESMRPRDRLKIRRSPLYDFLSKYLSISMLRLSKRAIDWCSRLFKKRYRFDFAAVDLELNKPLKTPEIVLQRMEGILSYIYSIKRLKEDPELKPEEAKGSRKLYRKFLYFRHFHVNKMPVIVTEGPTDIVYLKAAIRNLVANYPKLATTSNGKFRLKVKFLRHTSSVTEVMGLSGGSDPIKKMMLDYRAMISAFAAPGGTNPVIVVIDNDSGATGLYGALSNKFKLTLGVPYGVPATFVCDNLYLVSTPAKPVSGTSCIEDCFKPATLAVTLGGKNFNYISNKIDDSKEYGKALFAENVVLAQQSTIDFSGFTPLLDRIVDAIDLHSVKTPKLVAISVSGSVLASTGP